MIGKKKKILIIILIVVLIVAIGIGGTLAYLLNTTDLFRSNTTLFYKYFSQNSKVMDILDNNFLDRYFQKIDNNKYKETGDVSAYTKLTDSSQTDTDQFDSLINNLKIEYETQSNMAEKKKSTEFKVKYNNNDQITVKYARTNNNFGLYSDQIVNKYLVIRNNNLSELYTRLDIKDPSNYPNQISRPDYNILKNMDENDKTKIINTYKAILDEQITPSHFTKQSKIQVNVNNQSQIGNSYTLKLSASEYSNLKIKMLETLQTDETTLNYIVKFLQLDSSNVLKIKEKIQKEIDDIKRTQTEDSDSLVITVYEVNRTLVDTKIETRQASYDLTNQETAENQKVQLIKTDKLANKEAITTQLERITQNSKNSLSIKSETKVKDTTIGKSAISVEVNGDVNGSKLDMTFDIANETGNKLNELKITSSKDFTANVSPEELTSDNAAVINDQTLEQLKNLRTGLKQVLNTIFSNKVSALGLQPDTVKYQAYLKWSRIVDAFDENTFKMQLSRALTLAKEDAQNNPTYAQKLQEAGNDKNQVNQIKGLLVVQRLRETGLDASLNSIDNSISIKTNAEYAKKYSIDYDKFTVVELKDGSSSSGSGSSDSNSDTNGDSNSGSDSDSSGSSQSAQ